MTLQEEQYTHFVSSIDNLNYAWEILWEVKRCAGHPLIAPAFQFALIEYAKLYGHSQGESKTRHKLDSKHVPPQHRALSWATLAAQGAPLWRKKRGIKKGGSILLTNDALISPKSPFFACLYPIAE